MRYHYHQNFSKYKTKVETFVTNFNISGKEMLTPYQIANNVANFFNLDKNLITRTDSTQFKQRAVRPPAAPVPGLSPPEPDRRAGDQGRR